MYIDPSLSRSSLLQPQRLSKAQALTSSPLFRCVFFFFSSWAQLPRQGGITPAELGPHKATVYVIIPELTTSENFEECY